MSLNEYNIVSQARYKTLGVHDINFQSKNSSSQSIALTTDRSYDDIKVSTLTQSGQRMPVTGTLMQIP